MQSQPVKKPMDLNKTYGKEELFSLPADDVKAYIVHVSLKKSANGMIILSSFIGSYPKSEWNTFLGRDWVLDQIKNMDNLAELLSHLKFNENASRICVEFLNFIGQDWLRKAFDSVGLKAVCASLKMSGYYEGFKYLLEFLNGEDHWIRNKIQTSRDLSHVLHSLIMPRDSTIVRNGQLVKLTQEEYSSLLRSKWNSFIDMLDSDWKKNFLDNLIELKEFIDEWVELDIWQNTLIFFLSTYLDKKQFVSLEQIVDVLNFSSYDFSEEREIEKYAKQLAVTNKTFSFIQSFTPEECYNLLLNNRKFKQVLDNINKYHAQYFHKTLLYALTQAVYYEHKKSITHGFSIFGYSFTSKLNDTSADETLEIAKSLMSMLKNHERMSDDALKVKGKLGAIRDSHCNKRSMVSATHTRHPGLSS